MLYLDSFTHRSQLAEILSRWMIDRPAPGDLWKIKRIINFNAYMARLWAHRLAHRVITRLHATTPRLNSIRTKGQLKDFVVAHPTYTNARIEEMRARYSRFPEDFYRSTPIDGAYYTVDAGDEPSLVGMIRIKRFRRIAEKGSRRIVDFLHGQVRKSADQLAAERAMSLGIPKEHLATPREEMIEEFLHAERRVVKQIKLGTIDLPILAIPDVVGIKLIVEPADVPRLFEILETTPGCRLAETEEHRGTYNALNLRMEYTLPKDELAGYPPSGKHLSRLAFRGFDPRLVARQYVEFLEEAEDTVFVEVIVSDFQEYLESEIGRCMHEDRVLSQRANTQYNGHLATNVRYLMLYVLELCRAPVTEDVTELPIKLWVRYMPDTVERITWSLHLADDLYFVDFAELLENGPVD